MYLGNRGAGKGPHTQSRLGPLHTIQAINFVPNSSPVLGKLLMQIFYIKLEQGAWFLQFLPHLDKLCCSPLFQMCPCGSKHLHIGESLLRERKGRGLGEEKRRKNLTKNSCWGRLGFDGLWLRPVPRHLIKKVVQSCYAGIRELLPTFT